MRTRASESGRVTGSITPVLVSLCAQAMTSASRSTAPAPSAGAEPGSALRTIGSPRKGAFFVTVANLAENSPKVRCWERSRTMPAARASQNAVVPPLPRATS